MDELEKRAKSLKSEVDDACNKLRIDSTLDKVKSLESEAKSKEFWSDNARAQETMKELSRLQSSSEAWAKLRNHVNELIELIGMGDDSLSKDITKQLDKLSSNYDELKEQLKFSGIYDNHNAILSIYSGAGGTDAQDWAGMLERMYMRWAEHDGCKAKLIDESAGEEAGIKSATIEVTGDFVYGKLKGEHGVHRLVRLSPFNADNLRQTSFAKVDVLPEIDKPDDVEIDDKDLKVDVYRAGGHGGQSVNTTDSAVRITHLPTGITVSIQNERSQLQNKDTAMKILRSRLAQLQVEQHADKISELKGPNQSAEWGNQIRSYVLHPYKQVKDLRTKYETSNPDAVLDGNLEELISSYTDYSIGDVQ